MKTLKIGKKPFGVEALCLTKATLKTTLIAVAIIFCGATHAAPLLNGVAMYSELGSEKFMAGLYSSELTRSANQVLGDQVEKRIEVRVVDERLSTRRFKRMWIEGIAINSSSQELQAHAENMAKFSNMLKVKLKRGDVFAVEKNLDFINVTVNGISLGEIENPEFFELLLRTWVGFVPLSSDFRDNLLVQGSIKPELLSRYEQIQPSETRVASLEQAFADKAEEDQQLAAAGGQEPKEKTRIALKPEPVKVALTAPAVAAPSVNSSSTNNNSSVAANEAEKKAPEKKESAKPVQVAAAQKPQSLPKPAPVDIALPPQQEELDESIFEDDEADVEMTAEGLLIQQLYYSRLANYTQNYARYPRIAMERGREGSLLIRVTINREGEVLATEFIEETESYSLNKEAKRAVKRASPFPAIPTEINGEEFSFMFRLTFNLAAKADVKTTRLAAK